MLVPFVPECRVPILLSIISKLIDPKGDRGSPHVASDCVVLGCVQSAKRVRSSSARAMSRCHPRAVIKDIAVSLAATEDDEPIVEPILGTQDDLEAR
jgi:hypothetical protein